MLMVADPDATRRSTLDPVLPRLPGARVKRSAITRQMQAGQVLVADGSRRDRIGRARTGAGAIDPAFCRPHGRER